MFLKGYASIFPVRKSIDNKRFVKGMVVQFSIFVGNQARWYIHDTVRWIKHARFIANFKVLRKAVFENFIRERMVGMLFCFM